MPRLDFSNVVSIIQHDGRNGIQHGALLSIIPIIFLVVSILECTPCITPIVYILLVGSQVLPGWFCPNYGTIVITFVNVRFDICVCDLGYSGVANFRSWWISWLFVTLGSWQICWLWWWHFIRWYQVIMMIFGKRSEKLWGKDLEGCFLGTIMRVNWTYIENMCIIGK